MELPLETELRVGFIIGLTSPEAAQATAALAEGLGYDSVFGVGVGVGGEFPREYAACGVRVEERGARLSETIPLLKRLWSGEPVQHAGRFWSCPSVRMLPAPAQPGGPPVWSAAGLRLRCAASAAWATDGSPTWSHPSNTCCVQAMPWAARSFPRSSPIPSRKRVRGVHRGPSRRIPAA